MFGSKTVNDTVARLGGDGFVLLAEELGPDQSQADAAKRTRR